VGISVGIIIKDVKNPFPEICRFLRSTVSRDLPQRHAEDEEGPVNPAKSDIFKVLYS
jgi:hypothetical protein